ncbi:hypothetical protein HanIR_Chr11g0519171 [Helianthus annuus]|nr:hypothetical protein HanIR_Chr11g0519171 [Helianthus annuus]
MRTCCLMICIACVCAIVVGLTIGAIFGFNIYNEGVKKIKNIVHYSQSQSYPYVVSGRSFRSPPPF